MGLTDMFKGNEFKQRIAELELRNKQLADVANTSLNIKQMTDIQIDAEILDKKIQLDSVASTIADSELALIELNKSKQQISDEIANLNSTKLKLNTELGEINDNIEMQGFGLYIPKYDFSTALGYKVKLDEIRNEQKLMIKTDTAATIFRPMTLDGSNAKGKSMQKKNIKQLLRSFNGESEAAINKVTYSNIEAIKTRVSKSFETLNKLNEPNGVQLAVRFLDLKIREVYLSYEYASKKQEEKELLREQRAQEREDKQLQAEIAREKKKLKKEQEHYSNIIEEAETQLKTLTDESEIAKVKAQLAEYRDQFAQLNDDEENLDYREGHATAGYVYVISNIGAFGENVFKIGVTRRLDPLDRVAELGNASVPFKFDVHALIFSENAFGLEAELHEKFKDYRVNKVNNRKEYYNVPLSEIKSELEKHNDLTIDFTDTPDADEYRQSLTTNLVSNTN